MNACFMATVTGWYSFYLESLNRKYIESREAYELPVTWNGRLSEIRGVTRMREI